MVGQLRDKQVSNWWADKYALKHLLCYFLTNFKAASDQTHISAVKSDLIINAEIKSNQNPRFNLP